MSKQCEGLRALACVIEKYDILITGGVHISIAGDEVFKGYFDGLSTPDELRFEADFRDGGEEGTPEVKRQIQDQIDATNEALTPVHTELSCSLHGVLAEDGKCDVCEGRGIWESDSD